MDFHVESMECHGWVQGLDCENAFWSKEGQICMWKLRVVMWPRISFGYAMFHAYVKGGSYFHQVYSMLRCFYYQLCGCNESCEC
jgi:hypothetical protein